MSDHLKADIGRIREVSETVAQVADHFTNDSKLVARAGNELGSADLRHALEEFTGNWEIHRTKILQDLTLFSKWAATAADTYEEIDHQLAQALEGEET